jgi:hypothetical protein
MKLFGPLLLISQYLLAGVTIHITFTAAKNLRLPTARLLVLYILVLANIWDIGILSCSTPQLLWVGSTHAIRPFILLLELNLLFKELSYLRIFHQFLELFNRYVVVFSYNFFFFQWFLCWLRTFVAVAIGIPLWILHSSIKLVIFREALQVWVSSRSILLLSWLIVDHS